jgi:hypothetical protein
VRAVEPAMPTGENKPAAFTRLQQPNDRGAP